MVDQTIFYNCCPYIGESGSLVYLSLLMILIRIMNHKKCDILLLAFLNIYIKYIKSYNYDKLCKLLKHFLLLFKYQQIYQTLKSFIFIHDSTKYGTHSLKIT